MVIISEEKLSLEDLYQVLIKGEKIELDEGAMRKVYESYHFLKEFIKDKLIYGVNTGFGPMAQYRISNEDQIQLQYNLIRSHCSGSGAKIPGLYVKSVMIARLSTLMCGYSGIHADAVILLKELINRDIYPVILEHGGLGASGDLVQLAHVALTLIGEGEVEYKGGIVPAEHAFQKEGLTPLKVHVREGLALMNGTSAMSGIGALNLMHAWNLVNWSIAASAMIVEIVESYDDHYSTELNRVKRHYGQNRVAQVMQNFLTDSKLVKSREEHLYNRKVSEDVVKEKVQEYYSIRCVPQILGPVLDTIAFSEKIVLDEINSANDNPIIDYRTRNVYHGGNFHGDYVALEMDKLKIAITKLSMLSERQLNFLVNDKLNGKLPPFVNLGTLGLNLGMQGIQFTATSTTAENQTLSMPMYVHSIPSNNDNQDIVSMGSNAALLARKVINNTYEVMAVEFMAIMQAVDYLGFADKLSSPSQQIYKEIRAVFPRFEKDAVHYKELKNVRNYLRNKRFPKELSVQ
ncbi:MAG TPA: aromatic amino acid ammonia-lyase [Bacteroidia bacterium]|jgi:histidine ammonia-lyase|nr:aromatic amino acid ammonia-lyase [Bacteroidia bacterium]